MKTKLLLLLLLANFSIYAQYTSIPDTNFEQKLIDLGIDTDGLNGKVFTANISSVTDLSLYDYTISDLTGIEGFTSLTNLYISNNQLTNINLSQNTKLKKLNIGNNKLTSLDISSNTLLETLDCQKNTIANLNLSNNSNLISLNASNNQITSLDLSQNIQLLDLNIGYNKLSDLDISSNALLQKLDCRKNTFTILNISKNINLTSLNAAINQIASLDLSQNTQLKNLIVSSTKLTSLNIDNNTALTNLSCDNNKLTILDVSKNTLLTSLICHYNQIEVLDVSKNILLEQLMCHGNKLSALDVSLNLELNLLDCLDNKLISLDISKNPKITELACQNNQLQALNLKNGQNSILDLTFSDFTNNPNLYCIEVDDDAYSNSNWMNIKDATATYNVNCSSMFTQIPDVNFENKLIALNIDSGVPDGKVFTKNITNVTDLNVVRSSISDLTGIEDFTSLTHLKCDENNLTTLDVSKNTALTELSCGGNKLTTLDLNKNIALKRLICTSGQLKTLNISQCSELEFLMCFYNSLTSLDLSNNNKLQILDCSNNQLTNLSLGTNTSLVALTAENNQLTTLDVKENPALDLLDFSGNHIKTIDISNHKKLTQLFCGSNELKMLDVSKNSILKILNCSNNPSLQSLNLKNGNNTNIFAQALILSNNPALTCIKVDDVDYSNNNWTDKKDTTSNYNLDCPDLYTSIPDKNFEQKLIDLGIDSGSPDGKVVTASINYVTFLDVADSNITDLTGLQDFASLKYFFCDRNKLTTADFSKNLMLENIGILDNTFTSIDVTKNTKLHTLELSKNHIATVDLSQNTNLKRLGFENNNLKEIDLSHNTELWFISGFGNQLTSLDLSKNTALTTLNISNNRLIELNLKNGKNTILDSSLDLKNNPNLTCIKVDDVSYSNKNWSAYKDATANFSTNCTIEYVIILPDHNFEQKLIDLGIDTDGLNGKITITNINSITSLDLSNANIKDLTGIENFTGLTFLNVSNNQITTLDLSKNVLLETLNVSSNQITTLDLSKNSNLKIVYVVNNPLISLNLRNGNNRNFILPVETGKKSVSLYTSFLGLTSLSCIQVDDADYSNANWANIKEPSTSYSNTCKNLGLEDSVFNKVTMYPNPTKGEVHINNITLEKATVYNSLGQLVKSFNLNSANTDNTINLSGLPKGVYYIYLINQDAASAKKIIVE